MSYLPGSLKRLILIYDCLILAYLLESSPPSTYVAYVSATDADYGQNNEVEIKIKTYSSHHKGKELCLSACFSAYVFSNT